MIADALSRLDATAQAELVRSGRASALELVDAAIARLEEAQPELNITVSTDFERARARARALDASEMMRAPFAGVPTLLKDIGAEEAGQPLAMGMQLLRGGVYRPEHDSHFLKRLLGAGLIPLEPPAVCSGFHGLRVGPNAAGSLVAMIASSGMLVRPSGISPAPSSRFKKWLSCSGR